jgi:hypothetical protein
MAFMEDDYIHGDSANHGAQDALNRLRKAAERGTGCYLTPEMVAGLATTHLAETWSEQDPRNPRSQ